MAKFNASLHHPSLSQDSLQSSRGPPGQGTANVFEPQYPRVMQDCAEELELREVSSVLCNSFSPHTMEMEVEERHASALD